MKLQSDPGTEGVYIRFQKQKVGDVRKRTGCVNYAVCEGVEEVQGTGSVQGTPFSVSSLLIEKLSSLTKIISNSIQFISDSI